MCPPARTPASPPAHARPSAQRWCLCARTCTCTNKTHRVGRCRVLGKGGVVGEAADKLAVDLVRQRQRRQARREDRAGPAAGAVDRWRDQVEYAAHRIGGPAVCARVPRIAHAVGRLHADEEAGHGNRRKTGCACGPPWPGARVPSCRQQGPRSHGRCIQRRRPSAPPRAPCSAPPPPSLLLSAHAPSAPASPRALPPPPRRCRPRRPRWTTPSQPRPPRSSLQHHSKIDAETVRMHTGIPQIRSAGRTAEPAPRRPASAHANRTHRP